MNENLTSLIENFKHKVILVIGDVGLDKYIHGSVERVSPEAPVPVLNVRSEKIMPGLAGNTAANIASFGALVYLIGVAGTDSASETLRRELEALGIKSHLIQDTSRKTIHKTRIVGGKQQIARVDYESVEEIGREIEQKILNEARFLIRGVDAVVISDYGKGVITKDLASSVIALCKENGKKLIIDPKPQHREFYKGAFLITPNDKESFEMLQVKDVSERGLKLSEELEANILITLGDRGMALFEQGKERVDLPTQAKEVFDVSGAGDTVVATIALALGSGASLHEACILANHAAGIVVGKIGTAQVTERELIDEINKKKRKILSRGEIEGIVAQLKQKGKKIGFTSGSFDLVHAGHVDYLEKAKEFCDILIVGVNSDTSIKQYKSPDRPIVPEKWRARLIASLQSVDYVFVFDEVNNSTNITLLEPDLYIKAGDWEGKMTSAPLVEKYGGKVVNIPITEEIKTTHIINKIKDLLKKEELQGTEIELEKSAEKQKAVFLDRDGVINEDFGYVSEPEKFKLLPGVLEGVKSMQDAGYKIAIVTNQTGIGMGYYTREDFYKVNLEMFKHFTTAGIKIDKIYFCPHSLSEKCECRKPKAGLFKRAEKELNLDLAKCWMIGDKAADVQAGKTAGCRTILVATGHGLKERSDGGEDFFVADLREASKIIQKGSSLPPRAVYP